MASPFSLLTAGARFDKNRFKSDIELFSKADKKGKTKETLPASLNFFGDKTASASSSTTKPVKRKAADSDASGEDDDSEAEPDVPAPPKQKITLSGLDPLPASLTPSLDSLFTHHPASLLRGPLLRALKRANIHSLWGVQCAVGGALLAGRDTMCVAPTGSGKTLSYVLPTLVSLQAPARKLRGQQGGRGVRALVVVPTHDLAVQIREVVQAVGQGRGWRVLVLSKATEKAVCQAAPGDGKRKVRDGDADSDVASEEEDDDAASSEGRNSAEGDSEAEHDGEASTSSDALGIDVLIATPERLHHLLDNGRLSLAHTAHVVLDESDRLFSADFLPQVLPILEACSNPGVQKCFLSATMPAGAEEIGREWLRDGGVRVVVGLKDSAVTTVDQSLLYTGSEAGKLLALRNMVAAGALPCPSLVFVQSIQRADELARQLVMDGLRVEAVHSARGKKGRDDAISAFRAGAVWVLVVTEVLARGMDFRGVKVVVNYDFPQTVQSYIHRIGRTGRAGRPGKAVTFFSNEDGPYLRTIANVLAASGCAVPAYALALPRPSKNLKKQLRHAPVKRKAVGGGGRDVGKEQAARKRAMREAGRRKKSTAAGGDDKAEGPATGLNGDKR
ncbi:RNA-dependent ATPase rok1 [Cryptotrichosporon argae]